MVDMLCVDFLLRGMQIKNQNPDAKGVVNLSLGGEFGSYWEDWVKILTDVGLAVVAAAGNEDQDACTKSPAHVEEVLTVGATYLDDSKTVFSNYGSCVQVRTTHARQQQQQQTLNPNPNPKLIHCCTFA